MRCTWSLVTLLVIAASSTGCQQLGKRSACGEQPGCGCGSLPNMACHCGSGQPACGTVLGTIPATPPANQTTTEGSYEEAPQKPPMATPPASRTAPPPPPLEGAQAPRPLVFE